MKKYLLVIGLVAFLMTSCCDKQENNENKECCKDKKEQCDKHHHECEKPHHECDHHEQAPCPEMMVCMDKIIECVAKWDELDDNQRTEVIDMAKKMQEMKANMPKPECKKHEGECKHHEGECKHGEGHKCEGNHEGCQHQHEGCEHGDK